MTITDRKLRSTGALQGSSFSRVCQPNNCSSISVSRSVATDSKFCFVLAVLLACPACQDLTAKSVKKSALKVNFIQVDKNTKSFKLSDLSQFHLTLYKLPCCIFYKRCITIQSPTPVYLQFLSICGMS